MVKVIWHEAASPPHTESSVAFARCCQSVLPCNTWFLDPPDSAFQTASQKIQPFLHISRHGRVCLYFTMDCHFPLQNCPFTWGIWIPIYESHSINKLQNGVFWLFFKISKIRNIRFVGNLFHYSHRNFYNDDVIVMTSLVLKAQSHCRIFSCHRRNTIRPRSYE